MKVNLAYGRGELVVELPDENTTVIRPRYLPGLPDEEGAILTSLRDPVGGVRPLRRIAGAGDTVAISVCDITRPMPTAAVLPIVLNELARIPSDDITILIATGTHRANTDAELRAMLGDDVLDEYTVINHDAFDETRLAYAGSIQPDIPIYLNERWLAADIRITLGFVEPHFFAGFSGGPKMVAPGLAGFETIMRLHNADMIAHPMARWAVTEGNPIHDSIREIAEYTGVDFALDVTINRDHKITSVYAGEPSAVHRTARRFAKRIAMQPVAAPYDVALTTNGGYPLDQNLYQCVKGMSAAAQIVRHGGVIVCAAECSDGVPDHGQYARLLRSASGPQELLDMVSAPGHDVHDQWQVQIQAQIQRKATVALKSDGLTAEQTRDAHLTPVDDVERAIADALATAGANATLCVIPEGPQTIPYLADG